MIKHHKEEKKVFDDISPIPPLEGDQEKFVDKQLIAQLKGYEEEIKEEKRLKILTSNKLLTITPGIISPNKIWKIFIQTKKQNHIIAIFLY